MMIESEAAAGSEVKAVFSTEGPLPMPLSYRFEGGAHCLGRLELYGY